MEKYDINNIHPGVKLQISTESGSIYELDAVEPHHIAANLFRGFNVSRFSDHKIEIEIGIVPIDLETANEIKDEPSSVQFLSNEIGIIKAGIGMRIIPESRYSKFITSRIIDIQEVANEN